MKNITFLITLGLFLFLFQAQAQVRITKVDTSNGEITFKNFGGSAVDISNYRLCARFNYTNSGDLAGLLVSGNLNISSNAEVTVDWNTITGAPFPSGSDLGLYLPTGGFGTGANMVDFTQWGSSGNGRESVAVAKGIWTAGQFITIDGSAYVYTGNGEQNGNNFWTTENILSVEDNTFSKELKMYPNPSNNQFSIISSTELDQVKITNISGQLVKTINRGFKSIDISDLTSGIYLVEFNSKNKKGIKRLAIQ